MGVTRTECTSVHFHCINGRACPRSGVWVGDKRRGQGFPGGAVVKNAPANAGDMGSSPGPGRSHMLWSN